MQDRNLKRTVILTTLTTLLIGAGNATVAQDSSTYTLAPTADAYVQDGAYANSNFGGQGYLAVKTSSMGYNRDSFVRFDLTGVAGVESARLRFLASVDKSASIEVAIYASAAGWDEAAMTWNTRPERGQELGRFTVSSTAAAWHEINIEDYVNAEIAAGRTAIGVELHNPKKSSAIVKAHSREATTGKPELVYTTNTAGVPDPVEPPPDPGTTPLNSPAYFVSPTGSDSNPGTIQAPWRTVAKGLTSVQPGYTLYLRGGVYKERIKSPLIRLGSPTLPITVTAFPRERPVIQGLLWLNRPSYWKIDGINVLWDDLTGLSGEHMVKITNGVGWSILNCEFSGAKSYACLYIYGSALGEPSNWRVAYNAIHDTYPTNSTNQDHLIYCNSGLTGTGGVIERNLLWNAPNGDGVKLGGSSSTSGGAANVLVRYNTIYNTSMNVRACWTSKNNVIERNLLVKTRMSSATSYQYGNIRGYQLSGTGNIARDNMGCQAKTIIDNYDAGLGIQDGGGNQFPVDPLFDSIGPNGFRPRNLTARSRGRRGEPSDTKRD